MDDKRTTHYNKLTWADNPKLATALKAVKLKPLTIAEIKARLDSLK